MSFCLMKSQMMRVISSPSISTMGFSTLILDMVGAPGWGGFGGLYQGAAGAGRAEGGEWPKATSGRAAQRPTAGGRSNVCGRHFIAQDTSTIVRAWTLQ